MNFNSYGRSGSCIKTMTNNFVFMSHWPANILNQYLYLCWFEDPTIKERGRLFYFSVACMCHALAIYINGVMSMSGQKNLYHPRSKEIDFVENVGSHN